jgi:hypothetical protein
MFFNTDFYLVFNVTLDPDGKATCRLDISCEYQGTCGQNGICGKSPTYLIF